MKTTQTSSKTQAKNSTQKKQQSVNIGTPQVPLRKPSKTKQEPELLSDWEHAS
ncbi:hypothetical protein NIES4074_23560 [Cylindrospermum sp. NIES-4074]|nr:hypothetical protein NIES4074_23560 [Cylindrospermum sp. NIES-4074]